MSRPEYVSVARAARIAGISEEALRAMLVRGDVRAVRVAAFEVKVSRQDAERLRDGSRP